MSESKNNFEIWMVRWEYDRLMDEWTADAGARTDPAIRAFWRDDDNWKHNLSEEEFISEEVALHKAFSIATQFKNGIHEDFDRMRRLKNEKVSVIRRVCKYQIGDTSDDIRNGGEHRSYSDYIVKTIEASAGGDRPDGFYVGRF
jgi:hypothetical protein